MSNIRRGMSGMRKPNALDVERENFEKNFFQATSIQKAISPNEAAAKEKHIRSTILGTYQEKGAHTFWHVVQQLPLSSNSVICWKFCHVLHKLLRDGHPKTLQHSIRFQSQITVLSKFWGHVSQGYGRLISVYTKMLLQRMKFHQKYDAFPGNLFIEEDTLENIGNNDINAFFELSVDLFDYLDALMETQLAIFKTIDQSRAVSMTDSGQCRLSPCIPIILDSSQLYDYIVKLLFKMHFCLPADTLAGHRDRFTDNYHKLKQFYYTCSHMQYFKRLIQVPLMPDEPPNFLLKSDGSHQLGPVKMVEEEIPTPRTPSPEPEPVVENVIYTNLHKLLAMIFEQTNGRDAKLRAEIERLKAQIEHMRTEHMGEIRSLLDRIVELERELAEAEKEKLDAVQAKEASNKNLKEAMIKLHAAGKAQNLLQDVEKPSKTKANTPPEINFENMLPVDKRQLVNKLKGRRLEHEIIVETYENKAIVVDASPQRTYSDATANRMKKQRSKNASVSSTSSREDAELKEILKLGSKIASVETNAPSPSYERPRSNSPKTTKVPFFSGNPAVEITHGIIHLYKANYTMHVGEEHPFISSDTLCMLGVPADVDTHTILEFTASYCDVIKNLRIVRDRTPNEYTAIIKFSSEKMANKFFINFNNKPFSSVLPDEKCRMAFVASVEAIPTHGDRVKSPTGLLPLAGATELPDCTVCLERMDESVRGVLTILCNHSFHASCLQQWEDLCCPVCRYVQTPEPRSENSCQLCGRREDLWICLVCGNVGCGRYTEEHAQQHYLDTHHNYAMALSDNRVWDYAGDYFVHRLFQSKDDGKLVEQKDCDDSKYEAVQLECMYLLTSQLESQRKFWEEKLRIVEERALEEKKNVAAKLKDAVDRCKEIDDKYTAAEREKHQMEKKVTHLSTKYSNALKDLSTEIELNKNLRQNQDEWKRRVEDLESRCSKQDEEMGSLREQNRDLMFFLEAQRTINDADEDTKQDIQDGQIVMGEGTSKKRNKGKAKR